MGLTIIAYLRHAARSARREGVEVRMGGSVAPWRDPTMWGKRGGGAALLWLAVVGIKERKTLGVFLPGASGWA